jgi:lipoate-protein ligase A
MLCIHSSITDPFYNLAAEEFLLRNTEAEVFMLWRSTPAVVVGKHQNTLAEINYRFIREHNIRVARRLTGGGTVYHDPGNINFSFIRKGEPGKLVNFSSYIAPVISFLGRSGIEASQGRKNEILTGGKKISGNAEHVYKNRVLHHGTLLYSTNLTALRESISPGRGTYIGKAVQSNRSSVMNLIDSLDDAQDIHEFCAGFMLDITQALQGNPYILSREEQLAIQKLAREKYSTWDWIYGWSPDYEYAREFSTGDFGLNIGLKVHRGVITACMLCSAALPSERLRKLTDQLNGTRHEEDSIREKLTACGFRVLLAERDFDDLTYAFFC